MHSLTRALYLSADLHPRPSQDMDADGSGTLDVGVEVPSAQQVLRLQAQAVAIAEESGGEPPPLMDLWRDYRDRHVVYDRADRAPFIEQQGDGGAEEGGGRFRPTLPPAVLGVDQDVEAGEFAPQGSPSRRKAEAPCFSVTSRRRHRKAIFKRLDECHDFK